MTGHAEEERGEAMTGHASPPLLGIMHALLRDAHDVPVLLCPGTHLILCGLHARLCDLHGTFYVVILRVSVLALVVRTIAKISTEHACTHTMTVLAHTCAETGSKQML
jgi:hypothetical protein